MSTVLTFGTGIVMPLVVATVIQSKWPGWLKGIAVILSTLGVAVVDTFTTGQLTGKTFLENAVIIFTAAIAAYTMFWKPTGIASKVESVTNLENIKALLSKDKGPE